MEQILKRNLCTENIQQNEINNLKKNNGFKYGYHKPQSNIYHEKRNFQTNQKGTTEKRGKIMHDGTNMEEAGHAEFCKFSDSEETNGEPEGYYW
jgi:hypothetical protein